MIHQFVQKSRSDKERVKFRTPSFAATFDIVADFFVKYWFCSNFFFPFYFQIWCSKSYRKPIFTPHCSIVPRPNCSSSGCCGWNFSRNIQTHRGSSPCGFTEKTQHSTCQVRIEKLFLQKKNHGHISKLIRLRISYVEPLFLSVISVANW